MNKECAIVRDLIPAYIENVVSEESRSLVEAHCEECKECQNFLNRLNIPIVDQPQQQDERMKQVWNNIENTYKRKRNLKRRIIAIFMVILLMISYVHLMCRAQEKLTGHYGISMLSDLSPVYLALGSKSETEWNPVERKCEKILKSLITKSHTTLGDYTKLSDKDKKIISEKNFELLCVREYATDNEFNSLHRLNKNVVDEIMYFNSPVARQMNGYVLVTYDYYYRDYFKNEKVKAEDKLFKDIMRTVYVKMKVDGDEYFIEETFEPICPNGIQIYPKWAY